MDADECDDRIRLLADLTATFARAGVDPTLPGKALGRARLAAAPPLQPTRPQPTQK